METYSTETKIVSDSIAQKWKLQGELKMHASLAMLLKTHIGKLSVFGSTTMLMIINELCFLDHDLYENKRG